MQTSEHLIQFAYLLLYKKFFLVYNFSEQALKKVNSPKKFPRDCLINVATCFFAYHSNSANQQKHVGMVSTNNVWRSIILLPDIQTFLVETIPHYVFDLKEEVGSINLFKMTPCFFFYYQWIKLKLVFALNVLLTYWEKLRRFKTPAFLIPKTEGNWWRESVCNCQ